MTEAIGSPTPAQTLLIATAADMTVRTTMLSVRLMDADEEMAFEAERRFLWWSNALRRTLATLGIEKRAGQAQTLEQHLAATYGKQA